MMKIRNINGKPLPDGPLSKGEVVLRPGRLEALARSPLYRLKVLQLVWQAGESSRLSEILFNGQSVARKLQAIRVTMVESLIQWGLSKEALEVRGLRVANCRCDPGRGHLK